mmetsp:Transcript_10804/g.25865  ORF Transcript_10804/g.25865 Transcript_10804/m.25865 type:complete len:279 (+) Transcript_10804:858-1694(+)
MIEGGGGDVVKLLGTHRDGHPGQVVHGNTAGARGQHLDDSSGLVGVTIGDVAEHGLHQHQRFINFHSSLLRVLIDGLLVLRRYPRRFHDRHQRLPQITGVGQERPRGLVAHLLDGLLHLVNLGVGDPGGWSGPGRLGDQSRLRRQPRGVALDLKQGLGDLLDLVEHSGQCPRNRPEVGVGLCTDGLCEGAADAGPASGALCVAIDDVGDHEIADRHTPIREDRHGHQNKRTFWSFPKIQFSGNNLCLGLSPVLLILLNLRRHHLRLHHLQKKQVVRIQ